MSSTLTIPVDPHERRRLWRQWIHADAPQGERVQRPAVRRVDASSATSVQSDWLSEVLSAPPSVIAGLKRAIDESLVGPILPIADRERLIRRAMKLGLNRFEANLMIAAVQNRALERASTSTPTPRAPRKWSIPALLCALLLAEAGAVAVFIITR